MGIGKWLSRSKPTRLPGENVRVDQSDWTILGNRIAKRWGVSGPNLDYQVRIDIHKIKSNVSDKNEPQIFVTVSPHPLNGAQGILSMRFERLEKYQTAPLKIARLENGENGSCIIMHCDLQDTWQSLEVLGGSEPIAISVSVTAAP